MKLLYAAKEFDEEINQPNCHDPEKTQKVMDLLMEVEKHHNELKGLIDEIRKILT